MTNSNESTPLLISNKSSSSSSSSDDDQSIEEIIEPYLKGLKWRQILQTILGFLPNIFAAQQTYLSIFTDAKPSWHCTGLGNTTCSANSDICHLPDNAWSWDNPAHTSIISEWSLDCATNSIVQGLPASSFFAGCFTAGIVLFFICDSFGRKKILLISTLIMSTSAFFTAFSNNIWTYSALRFISGIGRSAIGTCALVLATESVEKKWQGKIGSIGFVIFTTGSLVLPVMAYFVRTYSWRVLYLLISIPGILYCILLQLFAYESPKWLLAQGREQEALQVLKAFRGQEIKSFPGKFPGISKTQEKNSSGFRVLMESKALSRQLLLLIFIGFGIGLVYYGVALGVGKLGLDIYRGAGFNALLQILSFVVVYLSVTKLKRKVLILAFAIISGVCCILLVCKLREIEVWFELVSFFCASTGFQLMLIYTVELFPTCARNSAVAMVWQSLMLGGVVSPVLSAAGGDNNALSYGIFGVSVITTSGLIVFLPETIEAKNSGNVEDNNA